MKDYNFLLIEKYIKGDLTPKELEIFDSLIKNGKNFANDVNLYKEIENALSSRALNKEEENDLRNNLERLGKFIIKEEGKKKESKVFSLQRYSKYMVAASLIIFAAIFWFVSSKPSYSDFANHQNIDLIIRGNPDKKLINAQDAFNAKDYLIAERELRTVLLIDKTKVELQLYLGICLLEQNKFKKAESIFKRIKNGKSIYKNRAIWYLALSKLKQKDYKSCKVYLETLPIYSEDYNNAQKLLKKL